MSLVIDGDSVPPDSISNGDPEASDKPSDNDPRQQQTEHDVPRHRDPSDLQQPDPARRHQTKPGCMVRRRSTVRFRNGVPAQGNNSNISNRPRGSFRGPSSSHIEPRGASVSLRSAGLCGLGGSVMDLLDCAEDHRRGTLDGPAHQVPGAVAVMYLGEPPADRYGLAVRAGRHVTASQNAGQYGRAGSNSELRTSASPRSPASMMAQEW